MRIGLQTWGSDGDIRPMIALAGGLRARGHTVTIVVTSVDNKEYRPLAESLGVVLHPVGHFDPTGKKYEELAAKLLELSPSSILRQFRLVMETLFEPVEEEMFRAAESLCAESDLVIGHFLLHPLHAAAERSGRPYVTVSLNHSGIPTRSTPPSGLPSLGKWINGLLWKAGIEVLTLQITPFINRFRTKAGLRPVARFREAWESRLLNLIAVSPSLCQRPPDWEVHQQVCGFFSLPEQAETWRAPDEMHRFLDAEPPVYMTFGSMLTADPRPEAIAATIRLLALAACRAGCRAIVQSPLQEEQGPLPGYPGVYRVSSVPHRFLFPRCAAVVHHGGAGTTQAAAMAGRPSIVVAHILDQLFWARELQRLGIAPRPLHRRSLTPEKLARAIRGVLDSPLMKETAGRIGARMEKEEGVARAVALIEALSTARPAS